MSRKYTRTTRSALADDGSPKYDCASYLWTGPKGVAMHLRHHEVMPYQDYYASASMPRHQTTYPGGHGR
jgi:hypothetical protein